MTKPNTLLLLAILVILLLVVAATEANNQFASPPANVEPLPIAQNITLVKHWGGEVSSLTVHGSFLYLNTGTELKIFTLDDAAAPVPVAALVLDKNINDLFAAGNFLYAAQAMQLTILDISDPTKPVWLSSLVLPDEILDITGSGDFLFLALYQGVAVVDLADPREPHLVYAGYNHIYPAEIQASDHYFYFTAATTLYVLDVSNPAEPVTVHHRPVTSPHFILVGNYLYSFGTAGTLILDVTNPATPQEVGTIYLSFHDLQVLDGDYLYLYSSPFLEVLNVANPLLPIAHDWTFIEWLPLFDVQNGFIYAIQGDSQIIFDANISGIPEVNTYPVTTNLMGTGVFIVDDYLYLQGSTELEIYDISDPLNPSLLSSFDVSGEDFALQDHFAYFLFVTCPPCTTYLPVVDVSDPLAPLLAGWGDPVPDAFSSKFKISGHYAFSGAYSGSYGQLAIHDITNPAHPTLIQLVPDTWPVVANDFVSVGDYLYLLANSTLEIIDFSDPALPNSIGSYQLSPFVYNINVVDTYLYAFQVVHVFPDGYRGMLHVLDISDPAAPIEVNAHSLPYHAGVLPIYDAGEPFLIEGDYAYFGYNVFNISDPANPILVAYYPLPGFWGVQGDYIYVSDRYYYRPDGWHLLKQTPVMVSLTPQLAGSLTYTYYQHFPTHFDFPAGSVAESITIAVNPGTAADAGGFAFAGHTFGLSALQGQTQLSTFTFAAPVTVTLHYGHNDIRLVTDEAELALWVWTDNGWQDATTTCPSPTPYLRDTVNNVLTLTICQTGRFALFGPTHQLYFPLILH